MIQIKFIKDVLGRYGKIKFPDKTDNKMGKICATSISTSGPMKKGSLKTYGICKKEGGTQVQW